MKQADRNKNPPLPVKYGHVGGCTDTLLLLVATGAVSKHLTTTM